VSEVLDGSHATLPKGPENCFDQAWVDGVVARCHGGAAGEQKATGADTVECHGQVIPTTAVDKATLTSKGAVVERNGRSYVRARTTTGHGVDFLVKGSGDLRRDRAWQSILHEFCRVAVRLHPRMAPVPTYGVLPATGGAHSGGLVVLLPGSVTLFSLLPVECGASPWLPTPRSSSVAESVESYAGAPRFVLQRAICRKAKDCLEWFAATRTMVSSIATGSVLGAATGLGDRHLANIMLLPSFHVAHIDLQLLCGDGALLPVPETVPFRFTPIISDAAGCRPEAFAMDFAAALTTLVALRPAILDALEHAGGIPHDTVRTPGGLRSTVYHPGLSDLAQIQNIMRLAMDPAKLSELHESWMPWL
jgi:hypothetical protein